MSGPRFRQRCPTCGKSIAITATGAFQKHKCGSAWNQQAYDRARYQRKKAEKLAAQGGQS